jgi:16S rRNA (cytidine1402-2'-O)-methyltransferase
MPLLVVATPIGHLDDLSPRARQALRDADVVYCEDTRHSRKLTDLVGSRASLRSFHEHNEEKQGGALEQDVAAGKQVVLISDAGTPCISDPGFTVVRRLRLAGLPVIPVPGPCAAIALLQAAGLPTDAFRFVGFAPRKEQARKGAVAQWMSGPDTIVVYESPQRVLALLSDIAEVDAGRHVVAARELTKLHETWYDGTAEAVLAQLKSPDAPRGEFVVGIAGKPEVAASADDVDAWVADLAATSLGTKEIASIIGRRLNVPSDDVYQRVLRARK